MMTLNANGSNTPPQMEVTISTPDGSVMTAVSLTRKSGGVTAPTRVQPSAGLASRFIPDPEAPWDVPVTYAATYTYAGGTVTDSATATLTPTLPAIWAIHPLIPALSMQLDSGDFAVAGLAEIGAVVRAAQATQHDVLGSELPILTRLGNRKASATTLTLTTRTDLERQKVLAIVLDETPLLIRSPAAFGWGFEEGYYAVGDVSIARRLMYGPDPSRTVTLPINRVSPPAGQQQSAWGWGNLLAGYADFPTVSTRFADWNALTGNTPS